MKLIEKDPAVMMQEIKEFLEPFTGREFDEVTEAEIYAGIYAILADYVPETYLPDIEVEAYVLSNNMVKVDIRPKERDIECPVCSRRDLMRHSMSGSPDDWYYFCICGWEGTP